MVQLVTLDPLEIKSDHHSANYTSKNFDTWIYTNSTEVTLRYVWNRLGQLKTNRKYSKLVTFLETLARFRDKT